MLATTEKSAPSAAMYRHRQVGYVPIAIGVVLAITLGGIAWRRSPMIGAVVLLLIMIGPLLFSSLTITVRDGMLASHFTFGFWPRQFAVADIADVSRAAA